MQEYLRSGCKGSWRSSEALGGAGGRGSYEDSRSYNQTNSLL